MVVFSAIIYIVDTLDHQIYVMKLRSISESLSPDVTIYHRSLIWPGTFVDIGAIIPVDARGLGFKSGKLTGDDTHQSDMMAAMAEPHPLMIDEIMELPDEVWIAALEHQATGLSPDLKYQNIRIIDKGYDGYNMMMLQYVADVNLKSFLRSMDMNLNDLKRSEENGDIKIIRSI